MNKHHELKIEKQYFDAINSGAKTFEIRKNDRNFKVGDTVALRLYAKHEVASLERQISYITDYKQQKGYVVLGLKGVLWEPRDL